MAESKIPYKETVITSLNSIGLSNGCYMRDILSAMPRGSRAVMNVTATAVLDVPKGGTLYIDRSPDNNTTHKSRIILITPTQSDPSLSGDEWLIGFVPFGQNSIAKWYEPTITLFS